VTWATFLHNHATHIWACDFAQTFDLFFRPLFIFVFIELGSRRIVHYAVTRNPTDAWAAQQLRNAAPFGKRPCYLICDNDSKYGPSFERAYAGIEVLRTPVAHQRQMRSVSASWAACDESVWIPSCSWVNANYSTPSGHMPTTSTTLGPIRASSSLSPAVLNHCRTAAKFYRFQYTTTTAGSQPQHPDHPSLYVRQRPPECAAR
jgi:hypothetical protein